jgi:SAM-dependent methyltransferase
MSPRASAFGCHDRAMRLVDDRGRARAFGGVAVAYDRARPSYPLPAVRWLLEPGCLDVIDLGAGTGKLTSMLVGEGHRVVAVEPLAPMRAKLAGAVPAIRVLAGRAEDIPAADRCADVVVVGQAFHWFDAAPALEEIARVLRPGGILGLLWNFRDRSQAWMRELAAVVGQDGLPEGWTRELERFARVTAVERRDFGFDHPVDRDTLVALVSSWSTVASLEHLERERILGRVRNVWDRHHGAGPTARAHVTYRTEAYRVRLA